MYNTERTSALPPQMKRRPRHWPDSRTKGATPTSAAMAARSKCPSSGSRASSVALSITGNASLKRALAEMRVALGRGDAASHVWVSDLGHGYITINAEYHT